MLFSWENKSLISSRHKYGGNGRCKCRAGKNREAAAGEKHVVPGGERCGNVRVDIPMHTRSRRNYLLSNDAIFLCLHACGHHVNVTDVLDPARNPLLQPDRVPV